MQRTRVDMKTFWAWLCLTNTLKLSESKYQADFGEIIMGQNPQAFMIPIYSTTVLYDKKSSSLCHVDCSDWPLKQQAFSLHDTY